MLDLFCGRLGWSKAFLARGWKVIGFDLVPPDEQINNFRFYQIDVLELTARMVRGMNFDFICASSPCEQFSVHGMKHFHPNPPYPALGIKLFNHTRLICEASGAPYVMENVRAAQQFVGRAVHHCGPFYLWGNAVPPLLTTGGIQKGINVGSSKIVNAMTSAEEKRAYRSQYMWNRGWSRSKQRSNDRAVAATIPPELANCVADYAERLLEQTMSKQ
jgi:hypothetical protein